MAPPSTEILVFGGTGFVGRALVARWARDGVPLRVLARQPEVARTVLPPGVEVFGGEATDGAVLDRALDGISMVYYLIHSMGPRPPRVGFREADARVATSVVAAARRARVDRIVYLGGLGDDAREASSHLASRREVGRILRSGPAAVTQLRAGIVIGPGGSSFEMMVQLVERLPMMICPLWIDRRCQPIALGDLVEYLVGCGRDQRTRGGSFDVGGPDVLRYSEMLIRIGRQLHRPPCLVILPRFTPALSAHWVGYITDVSPDLARPVIEGMYVDAVCRDDRIRSLLPIPQTGFDRAAAEALAERGRHSPVPALRGGHLVRPLEGRIFRLLRPGTGV